jgi:hypothetical protein
MNTGIATVTKVDVGQMEFEVNYGATKDTITVWFVGHVIGKQDIAGLEHLFGAQVGDAFPVRLEIIPPRTSTLTHLDVKAFIGQARERPAENA